MSCVFCTVPATAFSQEVNTEQYYCDLKKGTNIAVSSLIQQIDFVPLQVKSSCLINIIIDVRCVNNKYYVLDSNEGNILYSFDETGSFLNQIGRKGGGPGEYKLLSSFDVSPIDESVSILDGITNRFLVFDKNNQLKKSFNLGCKEFFPSSFRLNPADLNSFVFSANVMLENNMDLIYFKNPEMKTTNKIIKTPPLKINIPGEAMTFSSSKEYLYYYHNEDGVTYAFKNSQLVNTISVKFSKKMYLPGQITKNDLDIVKVIYSDGNIVTNYNEKITDDYIHAEFFLNKHINVLLINRKSKETYFFSNPKQNTSQYRLLFYPCSTTTDGKFIFAIDAIDVKDFITLIDPQQKIGNKDKYQQLLSQLNDNSNPVLFFVKYK